MSVSQSFDRIKLNYKCDYFAPVPEIFWSFETGKPFRKCSVCNRDLLEPGTNYLIEKAFQRQETIFEYAICMKCHGELFKEVSQQSQKLFENYFHEHVDMEQRSRELLQLYGMNHREWLSHCMIKGTSAVSCEEYQIYGMCIDTDLVFMEMPFMISSAVIEDLLVLLSDQTKGFLDNFADRVLGIDVPKGFVII